jgi:hypothetical protein
MAAPVFPEIDSSGIATMGLAKRAGQTGFRLRNSYQMHMIGHETPRPDGHTTFPAPLRQQLDIRQVIVITEKSCLPAIAPLGDMMGNARAYNACYSCHGLKIA